MLGTGSGSFDPETLKILETAFEETNAFWKSPNESSQNFWNTGIRDDHFRSS